MVKNYFHLYFFFVFCFEKQIVYIIPNSLIRIDAYSAYIACPNVLFQFWLNGACQCQFEANECDMNGLRTKYVGRHRTTGC